MAVVIVSFSPLELAKKWLEETKCPYPMYLDLPRKLYLSFGLPRSFAKVFSMDSLKYYGERVVQLNGELPKTDTVIKEDTLQLGGDFTVDCKTKTMTFLYPSQHPPDRPSVDAILRQQN